MSFPPNLVYMNGTRIRHRYPGDFTQWLTLLLAEEIEDIIGKQPMDDLVALYRKENQEEAN